MPRIRPVELTDAAELAALYQANRDYLAPFHPDRGERFFTVDGQRERLPGALTEAARGRSIQFAIVEEGRIAGAISVENVVRGAAQAASIGYWVSASDHVLFQRTRD